MASQRRMFMCGSSKLSVLLANEHLQQSEFGTFFKFLNMFDVVINQ